jgi:uncharacterized membrane protein YraQ (UPF0718 family)
MGDERLQLNFDDLGVNTMTVLMLFCTIIFVLVTGWCWEYLTADIDEPWHPNPRYHESKESWEKAIKDYEQKMEQYKRKKNLRNLFRGVFIIIGFLLFIGWMVLWWNFMMAL